MIEDSRLRVFNRVAELGSFTAAAKELGISQPAVSQNIAELERLVGEPLFVRSRSEISLTDKGRLFYGYSSKILYWYGKLEAVMIEKTEAPAEPMLLNLGDRTAEISSVDGEVYIKLT